jgi:hypothetical protein
MVHSLSVLGRQVEITVHLLILERDEYHLPGGRRLLPMLKFSRSSLLLVATLAVGGLASEQSAET